MVSVCLGGAVLVYEDSWAASVAFMAGSLIVVVRQVEVLFGLRVRGLRCSWSEALRDGSDEGRIRP